MVNEVSSIKLFRTSEHPCSYISDQNATTIFLDPTTKISQKLNSALTDKGFRRSGHLLYKPDCNSCKACIACRIPVKKFKSKSSFKRILKINQDIRVDVSSNLNLDESYALYESYINHRHLDGDMFPATEKQFSAFILENTDDTIFFKFFDKEKLIAVSVADILQDGLSAVYCFYDPVDKRRSLGTYAILYQIHRVSEQERLYLYLGYWIKNCRKMLYKTRFRPLEMLVNNKWVEVN